MAKLPDKFSLGARPVPQGGRGVVGISMDSPVAGAGARLGAAVAGLGATLHKRAEAEDRLKVAAATSAFLQRKIGIEAEFAGDTDYDTAGPRFEAALQQARAQATAGLSDRQVARFDAQAQPLAQQGFARLRARVAEGRRQAEATALTGTLDGTFEALKNAGLADQAAGLATTAALLQAAAEKGTIAPERARELGRQYAHGLDLHNFDRLPPEQRIARLAALEAGKGGAGPGATFDAGLRRQKREEAVAERQRQESQARSKAEREKIEGAARAALDRYGSSAEGEEQGRAALRAQFGDKAAPADRLYDGMLQARRVEERRGDAQAAVNAYGLALAGREDEIAPADRKRLHGAGQLDGILEAAQYARSANYQGDLLFKERLLAMTRQQRAGYGLGELAKRLSAQDFLEVAQAAAGEEDLPQRERMRDFVLTVQPMLRAAMAGEKARPEQVESDRVLLTLIHDELNVRVSDAEQQKKRKLSPSEYRMAVEDAADAVLLRHDRMERAGVAELDAGNGMAGGDFPEQVGTEVSPDGSSWSASMDEGFGMPSATPDGHNVAALAGADDDSRSEPQAYLTKTAQADAPETDGDGGEAGTLLAQRGGGGNRRRGGGPFGRSGANEREEILKWHEKTIRRLEPNNPSLSNIRDPNIPPSNEFLGSMARALDMAAFRHSIQISRGHGFREHAHEFGRNITSDDYAAIARSVVTNPRNRSRDLGEGVSAYYDRSRNIVVVVDPRTFDRGSMFRPSGGERYFNNMTTEKIRK